MHPYWHRPEQRSAYDGQVLGHCFQLGDNGVAVLMHHVRFDDGQRCWVNLPQHHFTLLEPPIASAPPTEALKPRHMSFEYLHKLHNPAHRRSEAKATVVLRLVLGSGGRSAVRSEATTKRLQAWRDICDSELPDMPHAEMLDGRAAQSTHQLLLSDPCGRTKAEVRGGAAFRLVRMTHGDSEVLALYVLSLAVVQSSQRQGHGSAIVSALKDLVSEEAAARGVGALILTQADLRALSFWRQQGLHATGGADEMLNALSEWRAEDNVVFGGAAPMAEMLTPPPTPPPAEESEAELSGQEDEGTSYVGKRRRQEVDYRRMQKGAAKQPKGRGS